MMSIADCGNEYEKEDVNTFNFHGVSMLAELAVRKNSLV
jgi:hypothetical protein